jgi:hypothetical protein
MIPLDPQPCAKCGTVYIPSPWQIKSRYLRCFNCRRQVRNAYEARKRAERNLPPGLVRHRMKG